jgi:GNAT superfamily N-acetyltransferase
VLHPRDVGHRVVVRRVAGRRDGRPLFTDALGELTSITDTDLTVATRTGPVTIAREAVVAAKRVPPRPVRRTDVTALEHDANEAWPAPVQERLGGWVLRAADGWSWRANSALVLGDPGRPLPVAIEQVRRWYADRGLPAAATLPLPLAARADAALAALGWRIGTSILVQTATVAAVRAVAAPDAPGVTLTDRPTPQWLALTEAHRHRSPADLPPAAHHVLTAGGTHPVRFAHCYDAAGDLIAAGRGTVTGGGRWLGLSRVLVVPAARRRGLAQQVVAALAGWAGRSGATDAFLQVETDNTAAIGLYAGFGFATHHHYVCRRP